MIGAAMCNHSLRATRSPPIKCGPMSRIASTIDNYIPTDIRDANHVKTRIASGCFSIVIEPARQR
jgi:hypothetical protein